MHKKGLTRFNTDANANKINVVGDCSGEGLTSKGEMQVKNQE